MCKVFLSTAISEKSQHWQFMEKCEIWLKDLESVKSPKRQLPCIQGWLQNINCLRMLWQDLHQIYGVKFLLMNRFNQDCLENGYVT